MSSMFGFEEAANGLDLNGFEPEAKSVDRDVAEEARTVGAEAGFHRRAPVEAPARPRRTRSAPKPAPAPKAGYSRVRVSDVYAKPQDKYQGVPRAQLNMMAPVPVVLLWRELAEALGVEQWRLLEEAVPLLRKAHGLPAADGEGEGRSKAA